MLFCGGLRCFFLGGGAGELSGLQSGSKSPSASSLQAAEAAKAALLFGLLDILQQHSLGIWSRASFNIERVLLD